MPALFPWWANSVARASLVVLVIIVVGVPVALMVWVRTSFATGQHADVKQPIAFDHRVHAHALRIDCRFCHSSAAVAAPAGLPPTTACVGCHTTGLNESTTLAPVRASLSSGKPIEWRRVNALPDFVFFDHSVHLAKGVGCETCHGRVDQMAQVSQAQPLTMAWCLSCHRDPGPHLRPNAAITAMGWSAPVDSSALAERLMRANHVQSRTTCSTCHR